MKRFAEIVDGTVTRVITAGSVEWCEQALGGTWVETFMDGTRVHRAAKNYTYDSDLDAFIPPKKFESWVLDETTCLWVAPVDMPEDDNIYEWNEATQSWDVVSEV